MSAETFRGKVDPAREHGVWYGMHALGRDALPMEITAGGRTFKISRFIKHDFFAATGFYADVRTGERAVLKMSRTQPFIGLPLRWLGRWINRREMRFYAKLADLPNVPGIIGAVGDTGFVHAFADGEPLSAQSTIPDDFFDDILRLIELFYARGMAIVDTNKPENILLGDDGRPHLIDFQISFDILDLGDYWPARPLLRMLRRTDVYHVLKHKKRLRPDLLSDAEAAMVERRSWPVRLHRTLTRPYFIIRRRLFAYLRIKGKLMPEGSK